MEGGAIVMMGRKEGKERRRRKKRGEGEQGLRNGDWSHQC